MMEHRVKSILDKRINRNSGELEYYVKWYRSSLQNSWEPKANLKCSNKILRFEKRMERIALKAARMMVESVSREEEKIGFEKGLAPQEILTVVRESGQSYYIMKWSDNSHDLVPVEEANTKCPQVVIAYFERIVKYKTI